MGFPLHEAIQNGEQIPAIKQLLVQGQTGQDFGRQPLEPDDRGASPIHCLAGARACTKRVEVLNLLLEHYTALGHTQSQVLQVRDTHGNTVYHLAAKYKRYQLISLLIELNADPFAENKLQWLPIHYAANVSGKLIKMLTNMMDHCPELSGRVYPESVLTPVQVAAKHCALESLKKFRERKYSFRPHGGHSLLNLVILSDSGDSDEAVKCLEYLLSIGVSSLKPERASSKSPSPKEPSVSPSPIHLAAQKRFPRILECLLENQWNAIEDLMLQSQALPSPLHLLARSDKKSAAECAQILLDPHYHKGGLENVIEFTELVDASGHTALDLCCEEGNRNTLVAEVILCATYDLDAVAVENVKWIRGQTIHKIYGSIPLALVPVLDLSMEQQASRQAELDSGEDQIMDYSLITGLDDEGQDEGKERASQDKGKDGIGESLEFWTESSHLHQVIEQDKHTRTTVLRHPLVKQYLTETWNRYNFLSYFCAGVQILILGSYLLFAAFCNCTATARATTTIDGDPHPPGNRTGTGTEVDLSCREETPCVVSSIIASVTISLMLAKEIFQLVTAPKLRQYFSSKYNMAQLAFGILGLSSVVLVMVGMDTHAVRITSVLGLLSVWFVALLQLQNLPPFGIYISIFGQVSRKSLKILLIFGLPTFFVFSQVFRLLIRKSQSPFHSLGPVGVAVKLLVLMIGELSFDETFQQDEGAAEQEIESILALLVFTLFAFIATIVILNLLLAIAVDISQDVYSNAEAELAKCQLEQIYLWETLHPKLKSFCDLAVKRLRIV